MCIRDRDYAGGLEGTYDNPAYQVPGVMVMWGKMPLASNGDGLWGHAVIDLMKRGAKLISVDPRVNWLATRAEVHLRVRPGTDTAMALSLIHICILVNYEYCTGCHSCEVACKKHLGLPAGEFGIKVAEIGPFEYEGAKNNKDRWEWTWMPVLTKACDMCEDRVAKGKRCV